MIASRVLVVPITPVGTVQSQLNSIGRAALSFPTFRESKHLANFPQAFAGSIRASLSSACHSAKSFLLIRNVPKSPDISKKASQYSSGHDRKSSRSFHGSKGPL